MKFIIVIQGSFEIIGLFSFLIGFFIDFNFVMIIGGILVVLDDLIVIFLGILNPFFPVFLGIILAIVLTPWYVGVFCASASFKVLGIPTLFIKVFKPQVIIDIANQ